MTVLDASAVLAWVQNEPGSSEVTLQGSVLTHVNYLEVVSVLTRKGKSSTTLQTELALLGVILRPLSLDEAQHAGEMITQTKSLGLSLGDRACLAVADLAKGRAVTADKIWKDIKGIQVQVIRH